MWSPEELRFYRTSTVSFEEYCNNSTDPPINESEANEILPDMTFSTEDPLEWEWDPKGITEATLLKCNNRVVCFSPHWSSGTVAVRGNKPFVPGWNYFWEIEMISQLYGTDAMVGVGTAKVDLKKYRDKFVSFLGSDEESWGYSFHGKFHHNGAKRPYGLKYGKDSVVGVRLDMWMGALTFYLDGDPLGVAFTSLNAQELYPIVCSTAARSAMRLVSAESFPFSLQLRCCQILRTREDLMKQLQSIPGLWSIVEKAFRYPSLQTAIQNFKMQSGKLNDGDSECESTEPKLCRLHCD